MTHEFPTNVSKLVANNLSMYSTVQHVKGQESLKVNWCNMTKMILIFVGVNNCYWITIYNVTYLDGNKFLNGAILGVAELTSGIFAGFVITYSNPTLAFRIFAVIAVVFNAITQFVVPVGTALSYCTLFIAVLGVGGVYTVIYVLIKQVFPQE